jgi:hypothetical protein
MQYEENGSNTRIRNYVNDAVEHSDCICFSEEPDPVTSIEFRGRVAISIVPEIIRWRITINGTVWINGGEPYEGQYTIVRMNNGDILHGPATYLRMLKMKIYRLRMRINAQNVENTVLSVFWKSKSPVVTGSFEEYGSIGGDVFSFDGDVHYTEADVSTI